MRKINVYIYYFPYRKEQRKTEEKIVIDHPISTEHSVNTNVEMAVSTITSAISTVETPVSVASIVTSSATVTNVVSTERDNIAVDTKSQLAPITMVKKASTVGGKPIAVLKTNAAQSLLQSNQHNFPHHQIQVSTSAGLQTIRLSGHSVLQSAQQSVSASNSSNVVNGTTTNLTTILPSTKVQNQQQQQSTIVTNQAGKSILQTTNIKQQQSQQQQQQQQHVLPGKTLLASQIKLVSSSQIKSLLTSHGLQGQTIFIKQSSPSNNQSQQQQLQQQQQQQQLKVSLQTNFAFITFICFYLNFILILATTTPTTTSHS